MSGDQDHDGGPQGEAAQPGDDPEGDELPNEPSRSRLQQAASTLRRFPPVWGAIGLLAAVAVTGFALALAASSRAADQEEDAQQELANLEEQSQEELEELEEHASGLTQDLEAAEAELEAAEAEREAIEDERDGLASDLSSAESEAAELETEADRLREEYDPEIRAEREQEVEDEVARACAEAEDDIDSEIGTLVEYDSNWDHVTDQESLVAEVAACAEDVRTQTEAEREEARLAECSTIDRGQVERNPEEYEGECLHMFARIVQFDSATGPCAFHARVSAEHSSGIGDYDVRSAFGYEDSPMLSALTEDCPDLDGITNNDIVEVWATGRGSYSYDTTIGGGTTVPAFKIDTIELIEARD
ncbi:hypothetical protein ER308_04525 [Egibacter rhizosphaerae]|uniref:Uncharacterized protein n=1 Tax=Egibacter rhizosphaerae TaxID=1670831 RepID=A0A411YCB1_9ACTN|nr:hypothetical protein [Egibacter rhizosphaerae]QBI18881.1 hypothetical protein ER308_04525 [Egibacter rhizosphaerae]